MGAVTVFPDRTGEAYVTGRQLADMMGVSERTVERWRRQGMPSVVWGRKARRYRPSLAMAWAQSKGQ